jgi:hypothetical protein
MFAVCGTVRNLRLLRRCPSPFATTTYLLQKSGANVRIASNTQRLATDSWGDRTSVMGAGGGVRPRSAH